MVDAAAPSRVLHEDQLQRRLGDREVGVTGADLRRFGVEQPAVEADRFLEVVDVEGELETGHGYFLKKEHFERCLCVGHRQVGTRYRRLSILMHVEVDGSAEPGRDRRVLPAAVP